MSPSGWGLRAFPSLRQHHSVSACVLAWPSSLRVSLCPLLFSEGHQLSLCPLLFSEGPQLTVVDEKCRLPYQ